MSGDVQPRKRKDKRKKKDDEEILHHHGSIGGGGSDEVIHIHKESKLGGNICAKIVFFGLLGALSVMVGLIIIEYHGTSDVDTQSTADSPWSVMLEGWVDDSVSGHDDHDEHELSSQEEEDHDEHDHDDEHDSHDHEGEYSEGEHEEHEEEEEGEGEDVSFVKQTYEDLRAAYNQVTPEESEAEINEEDLSLKSNEYGTTESEPEASETEEEEEEESVQEDDPLGQWKSASGPELLAEEVEDVQTGSETEEESEDEVSGTVPASGGPQSIKIEETQENIDIGSESAEHDQIPTEANTKEESYEHADFTNQADWEIKEELDEAERDLDDGDFPV